MLGGCSDGIRNKRQMDLLTSSTLQKVKSGANKTGEDKGMPPPEYEEAVAAILGNNTYPDQWYWR